jgi:hypothetical protein
LSTSDLVIAGDRIKEWTLHTCKVTSQWTVDCHFVAKLVPNRKTIPRRAFINAEPADKRNKKSSKLGKENVQNSQHSETHNTGDGVIYWPGKDT